tara:strand:+ start:31431 stop:31985 length:555 start_codon:yes stop_codon:yes gene_type:complete
MNLIDALKLIDNDTNSLSENSLNNNSCLITREPIKNEFVLKCGHKFEYDAILENLKNTQSDYNYHVCPYCRSQFNYFIPFFKTDKNQLFDKKLFKKNEYFKCQHIFKLGINKGECCNKQAHRFDIGTFCYSHYNKKLCRSKLNENTESICYCKQILKNGNNCKYKVFDKESQLCKRHYNLSNKI